MTQISEETVVSRIRRLERAQAQTRAFAILVALGGLCVVMLGLNQSDGHVPSVLRAKRFVLVDQAGRELAVLGPKENAVGLYIHARTPEDKAPLLALEVLRLELIPQLFVVLDQKKHQDSRCKQKKV